MRYSREGRVEDHNENGKLTEEGKQFSLLFLLDNSPDFKAEMTDLEHLAKEVSTEHSNDFLILYSPKFHCELAGEGIEYSWGASKRLYRKKPLYQKRSFEKFIGSVKECISKVTPMMCQRFSMKARRYMLVYHHLSVLKNEAGEAGSYLENGSLDYNEKLMKTYKSHRDANIIDGKFIERVMSECIGV